MSQSPSCEHIVSSSPRRIAREQATVAAMIRIFCRARHKSSNGLCAECAELQTYALSRLARCPFGQDKPTCANCQIHCYKPQLRERIREVMRYAGPRMLWRHPILAVRHLLDGRRSPVLAGGSKDDTASEANRECTP